MSNYVIGVDFGTDSVRSVLVDAQDGKTIASEVFIYPRWKQGKYCDPTHNQFRQHPLDHLEGLQFTIQGVVKKSGVVAEDIKGICVDTTGSSPLPVDKAGEALALNAEFAENPNAMMVLWKDHTGIAEAEEINVRCRSWGGVDYTQFEGGIYSSEWFWSKILHITRIDPEVAKAAYSWVEHCDYITASLTGCENPLEIKRSRCAAGHKALWHESWGGLPSKDFLSQLDPQLADLRDRLYSNTYTSDESAGTLSEAWSKKLGLNTATVVAVGTFDAHAGAVGGEVKDHTLVKVMGTSTCDIMITTYDNLADKLVKGICGQVDGSVVPGTVGLEAGQSGFGDVLAWFKNLLIQPVAQLIEENQSLTASQKANLIEDLESKLLNHLSDLALQLPPSESAPLALDWINGRRTPDANQALKGAIMGLTMGTDAARIFKALVESICFGSKSIVERFKEEGIEIKTIIGLGGVAKKSPLVMQTMANILNMPIQVASSEQAPALGAAMYAAVAAAIHPDVQTAIQHMGNGVDSVYYPQKVHSDTYAKIYKNYLEYGKFVENF
jgi:L-ribulokinase